MVLDGKSKRNIEEAEKRLGHESGIGRISRGTCPRGYTMPHACMFCPYGHMLECHYPLNCYEAKCSHYNPEDW